MRKAEAAVLAQEEMEVGLIVKDFFDGPVEAVLQRMAGSGGRRPAATEARGAARQARAAGEAGGGRARRREIIRLVYLLIHRPMHARGRIKVTAQVTSAKVTSAKVNLSAVAAILTSGRMGVNQRTSSEGVPLAVY